MLSEWMDSEYALESGVVIVSTAKGE